MSFFAVITFDLEGAKSTGYKCVKEKLEKLSIKKTINRTRLPSNVFVGKFKGDKFQKSAELRDHINLKVEKIFRACRVNGPYFIFVGDEWSWKKAITR